MTRQRLGLDKHLGSLSFGICSMSRSMKLSGTACKQWLGISKGAESFLLQIFESFEFLVLQKSSLPLHYLTAGHDFEVFSEELCILL